MRLPGGREGRREGRPGGVAVREGVKNACIIRRRYRRRYTGDAEEDEDSVDYDSQESSSDEDELPPPSMQHFADEVSETKAWRKQDKEALLRTKRKMRRKKRLGKPPSASDRAKLESRLKFAKR